MSKNTIDMAREVKATAYTNRHYPDRTTYTFGPEQLKAFEALVRADAIADERSVEREACSAPTVPDALTDRDPETPEYREGWNDCRALMLNWRNSQ
jgi:hypothetical protein